MKVYQAISDALHAEGVTTAFALMGDANQNLFVDMAERHRVQVVSCRHEQNVVAIADGYTRFGRDIGVALVTAGPGLTNAATSLVAAKYRRSPVLVLAGAPSLGDLHSPQLIDQVAFGQLLAGTSTTLETPESLAPQLDRVFGHMRRRRGPVVLNLPSNVQNMEAPKGWSYSPNYGGYSPTVPRGEELLVAARCLAESRSPKEPFEAARRKSSGSSPRTSERPSRPRCRPRGSARANLYGWAYPEGSARAWRWPFSMAAATCSSSSAPA
jgi:thiamine pyrophosphate-dependent acetolactate synthase large subunit-like protein